MDCMKNHKLIRLSKSCIGDTEKSAVSGVLERELLGMGAEVQQFEQALTEFFNRPTVCVVNGTAALHLALQACCIGPEDEVLVPSLTYVASFQAISATGAKPIACDIDADSILLSLEDAEKRITAKTRAVMPVHYSGGVGDLNSVYKFAERHKLRVIEDAAHAFGTIYMGKRVGSLGDIACFSFDGIKNITSGEGGCIVTDDNKILSNVRDARLLSVDKDTENRYKNQRTWEFNVTTQGWRYHLSNIMAAIGLEQLKRLPEFTEKRRLLAKKYDELLIDNPEIKTINRDYNNVVPHIYPVLIRNLNDRKQFQSYMLERGIQIGFHYQPNHVLSLYQDVRSRPLPVTERIAKELISLPLHPDLEIEDLEYIVEQLPKELK